MIFPFYLLYSIYYQYALYILYILGATHKVVCLHQSNHKPAIYPYIMQTSTQQTEANPAPPLPLTQNPQIPPPSSSSIIQPRLQPISAQDQQLFNNFMKQPFVFVAPPLFWDPKLASYRDNFNTEIQSFTDKYNMFNQKYNIKTGQIHIPIYMQQDNNNNNNINNSNNSNNINNNMGVKPTVEHQQWSKAKGMGLKMKIYNFKFMGYSLYATLIQSLKNLRKQSVPAQKIKSSHSLIKKKIQQFYNESSEIKQMYRRMQVIHMLQKQTQYLEDQTAHIDGVVDNIQRYVDEKCEQSRSQ